MLEFSPIVNFGITGIEEALACFGVTSTIELLMYGGANT
ncbi:Uncharacterised protein [Legionella pneumophila]|nr:Uncharacterised protein [Legionella pneumophila]CZG96618.1 Uncharacterised protein [Legionella pneumophila]CZH17858.1 Uncharacterised protein [Legionella pneumophila]CZH19010.1 Uncharacterised protein [Legionella pneumophila]CZH21049.1 Uncharacterised protein [Legionella pneumophila]